MKVHLTYYELQDEFWGSLDLKPLYAAGSRAVQSLEGSTANVKLWADSNHYLSTILIYRLPHNASEVEMFPLQDNDEVSQLQCWSLSELLTLIPQVFDDRVPLDRSLNQRRVSIVHKMRFYLWSFISFIIFFFSNADRRNSSVDSSASKFGNLRWVSLSNTFQIDNKKTKQMQRVSFYFPLFRIKNIIREVQFLLICYFIFSVVACLDSISDQNLPLLLSVTIISMRRAHTIMVSCSSILLSRNVRTSPVEKWWQFQGIPSIWKKEKLALIAKK